MDCHHETEMVGEEVPLNGRGRRVARGQRPYGLDDLLGPTDQLVCDPTVTPGRDLLPPEGSRGGPQAPSDTERVVERQGDLPAGNAPAHVGRRP